MVLPQRKPVIVPGGKVADVQADHCEACDLRRLSLREEPIGDAALIENLDRACVQTARARAGEVLAGAPFDDGNIDTRQRQLARQHQSCRTSSDDHHRMVGLRHIPLGSAHFVTPQIFGFGRRFYGMTGVLKQARGELHIRVGDRPYFSGCG
jgi:hypothetical protein